MIQNDPLPPLRPNRHTARDADIHGNIFQKNHGVTQKPHIINVHGHYIIFKGSFEHSPSMNIAFIRSRGIANKYDTPLNYDIKNINVNRE